MINSILELENIRRIQINEFNERNKEDSKRNYFNEISDDNLSDEELNKRKSLAKIINSKLNSNSVVDDDILNLYNQCISEKEYNQKLLQFELQYFRNEPKPMTLDEFKVAAFKIFDRYQSKAGGKLIEDIDWIVYTSDDVVPGRVVMKNELLFENSIPKCDCDNKDTTKYLKLIVKHLRSLCDDITVDLRYKDDHNISFIWIWCTHKKMDSDVPKIDL